MGGVSQKIDNNSTRNNIQLPMNPLFEKPYEEEFARQCIAYCFPELGWDLILNKDDPPDLLDYEREIGIEVTGAKSEEDNELEAAFEKYKGCEENEIPSKLRKKLDAQTGKLLFFPDDNGKEVLKACYHGVRKIDYHEVISRIVSKTRKLNKEDYSDYKIDGLFVNDSHSFFWGKSAPDILEEIECETRNYNRHFLLIFVFCHHDIYLINTESGEVVHKSIKDAEIQKLVINSLEALGRNILQDSYGCVLGTGFERRV